MGPHELLLGGVKSGKSRCAQSRAGAWLDRPGHEALLIVTALPGDAEMRERIARHRAERARELPALQVLALEGDLGAALRATSMPRRLIVVDCLTLWLTQQRLPLDPASTIGATAGEASVDAAADPAVDAAIDAESAALTDRLCAALDAVPGPVVLVSNEIGLGVLPLGRDTRRFLDALGMLHQRVAACCARVTWMVAGLEVAVKPAPGAAS